jgi:hypothetical protein
MGTSARLKGNAAELKVHVIVIEDFVIQVKPSALCSFFFVVLD